VVSISRPNVLGHASPRQPGGRIPCTRRSAGLGQRQRHRASSAGRGRGSSLPRRARVWSRNTGQLRAFKLRLNAGNEAVWRWRYERSRLPRSWRQRWKRKRWNSWRAARGCVLPTLYDLPRFGEKADAGQASNRKPKFSSTRPSPSGGRCSRRRVDLRCREWLARRLGSQLYQDRSQGLDARRQRVTIISGDVGKLFGQSGVG
jgi:hypothetical protein